MAMKHLISSPGRCFLSMASLSMGNALCSLLPSASLTWYISYFLTLPLCPHNGFPASQQDYRGICMEPTRLWFKHAPLSATRNASTLGITLLPQDMEPTRLWFKHAPLPATKNASMLGITLLPQDMEPTKLWFKHAPLPATSNASTLGTIFLPQGQLWAHLWATALVVDEVWAHLWAPALVVDEALKAKRMCGRPPTHGMILFCSLDHHLE